jgi:TRAP-type C4-dicarboxylate transport system permease small subunit
MTRGDVLVKSAAALDRAIESLCGFLIALSGIGLTVVLAGVVVLRYGFASGISASVELTELAFAVFVMAGIALAARHGAHVTTRLTLTLLKGRARLALALLVHAATAAVYLLLAWYTYQNALIAHDQLTPVLDIPYSVGYGILAVGLLLVSLSSLTAIVSLTLGGAEVPVEATSLEGHST